MQVDARGIAIEVERHGNPNHPAFLLANGYTSQLITWPKLLIDGLVDAGFQVVAYDNRDVGLSQKFPEGGQPVAKDVFKQVRAGNVPDIPYTLSDMAGDGIAVLDALGIGQAHVFGISMGGMLVQMMAIEHSDRVLSMTSVMSTTGNPDVPPATKEAQKALMVTAKSDALEDVLEVGVPGRRAYESPAWPKTDEGLRELITASYERSFYPEGNARQYAAILGDGNRVERLGKVTLPSLVIHGRDDALVRVEGGMDTAKSIPGAKLEIIEGMGHDLPDGVCPKILELIVAHARAAQSVVAD